MLKKQTYILKEKTWLFENFAKSCFILNRHSKIQDFSTLKIHKNLTDCQNPLKSFLSDRGEHNIKSQEVLGPNCSPTVNKIMKTKKEGESTPPP